MNRRSERGVETGVVGRRSELTDRKAVPDDEIHVLLVDDDERWARYIAGEIEEHGEFRVTVTLGANEAMLSLQDSTDVDCVVADYRMPEVDGLQLLERVRDEYPGLPFIIVTGEGSEGVATRALEAGVSDYLVKDPRSDQASLFVNRIRTIVDQHRLGRAIEESEDRYRTVTEQSRDAIAIVRDGDLLFWNRRLRDLTGRADDELATLDFVGDLIHEHERDQVGEVLVGWQEGDEGGIHEARVVPGDGDVRHCEYTGGHVRYDDREAALLSLRDVTEHKRRERELAWERDLNRTVQNVLIESRTREQLERAVTSQLCSHGYATAWVGALSDGRLAARAVRVEDEHEHPDCDGTTYVDALDFSMENNARTNEPAVWAARTGEAKFVGNFEELFSTEWRDVALKCGFGGGAAVPLSYNDISYGVLAVYHASPDRFDETERKLLAELADTVAFAVHHIETETALASEHSVEVTVGIRGTEYYLAQLREDPPFRGGTATVTVDGTVPQGDQQFVQYVSLEGVDTETFRELAGERDEVIEVAPIDDTEGRLQVHVSGTTPEAMLASQGIVVGSTTLSADGATLTFELSAREDVRSVVDSLDERFGSASVQSVVEREHATSQGSGNDLTEKQAAALQAAYHHGYFEKPRKSSATEVADALDVTHSTFLHHLRTAQQKVFARRYD